MLLIKSDSADLVNLVNLIIGGEHPPKELRVVMLIKSDSADLVNLVDLIIGGEHPPKELRVVLVHFV